MDKKKVSYEDLLRLILPSEIFDYFDVIKVDVYDKEVHLFVDEKNILPEGLLKRDYQSKGFYPCQTQEVAECINIRGCK